MCVEFIVIAWQIQFQHNYRDLIGVFSITANLNVLFLLSFFKDCCLSLSLNVKRFHFFFLFLSTRSKFGAQNLNKKMPTSLNELYSIICLKNVLWNRFCFTTSISEQIKRCIDSIIRNIYIFHFMYLCI